MEKTPAEINKQASLTIALLKEGQPGVLEALYDKHHAEFLDWASWRFYGAPAYFDDAWQEAIVVFYERVQSGRLKTLDCSVKTFLFAVGKKWLLKNERKQKRFIWKSALDREIEQVSFEFDDLWEDERILLKESMLSLSPKCQTLLTQRHFDDRSIAELIELHQSDANNISSNLSQCLKKLKTIIQEKTKK